MVNHRRHRERRPARNPASREPKRRLLIVCGGRVTEPTYLRGLERLVHNARLVIDMPEEAQGSDPRTLAKRASDLREAALDQAHRERDAFLAYDEVWCVFDVDEHRHLNDACQLAAAN